MTDPAPLVAVIMGSDSDLPVMNGAIKALRELSIPFEAHVVSAHRTPEMMIEFGKRAAGRGIKVIIAGAGGAAHLPGMVASVTSLPVIGVPVAITKLQGLDALLSIVQMPGGVPVATVGVDNARNAGLLAARILATSDIALLTKLDEARAATAERVLARDEALQQQLKDSSKPGD